MKVINIAIEENVLNIVTHVNRLTDTGLNVCKHPNFFVMNFWKQI